MAKRETVPTSSMQKPTTPRSSLDKHASSHSVSPPRTPPSQISRAGKGKGGGGARAPRNRPALRSAFEDTPSADNEHRRNRSNSHDLSWSPKNTRDSVVDNMLLSLDQFSSGATSSRGTPAVQAPFDLVGSYAPIERSDPIDARARGHTFSSSVSSDYSLHADTPKSNHSRGHRSNSSTNFQSTLGRIDSIRRGGEDSSVQNREQEYGTMREHMSTNTREGTKGNGSSSFDFGQLIGSPWQRPAERRSSSFDQGYQRPTITRQTTLPPSTSDQQQELAFIYDDMDAAPTPTIPVGPRRNHSPAPPGGLRPDSALSHNPVPRRRGSIRSPMALFSRGDRTNGLDQADSRIDSRPHIRKDSQETRSSFPASDMTPNKGRAVSSPLISTPSSANTAKDKDRPGFFKRVFGSARGAINSPLESPAQKKTSSQNNVRAGSRNGTALANGSSDIKTSDTGITSQRLQKEPTKEKPAIKEHRPQTLNKKSSFFRRRKKSVTESARPALPQVPPQSQLKNLVTLPAAETTRPTEDVPGSPVSSLRKVMNAYLDGPEQSDGVDVARANGSAGREAIRQGSFANSTIRATNGAEEDEIIQLPSFPDVRPTAGSQSPKASMQSYLRLKEYVQPNAPALRRADTDRLQHHHRTQSDVDKDLPRLPVNYKAFDNPEKDILASNVSQANVEAKSTALQDSTDDATIEAISVQAKEAPEKSPRLWLRPRASEEEAREPTSGLAGEAQAPGESARTSASTLSDYRSATSKSHSPIISAVTGANNKDLLEPEKAQSVVSPQATEPSKEDRTLAQRLFVGEGEIKQSEIAAWLGEEGLERGKVRRTYMELFDWKDMSILSALRDFCGQVVLKGETQQVDRVLDAASVRWCDCNPNHGFKATDVVHTICYSVLLLNTDLHMADIEKKMTRVEFIRNTMPTIRRVVRDAAPDAFETVRGSMLPPPKPQTSVSEPVIPKLNTLPLDSPDTQDNSRSSRRLSTRPANHFGSESQISTLADGTTDECGPLVKAPFNGKMAIWEAQIEFVLKEIYNSIRQERLPLHRSDEAPRAPEARPSSTSLSAMTGGMLRRTNSMLSKTGSETMPARGRALESKMGSRWSSKGRSRPRLYPASLAQSRTSFDDDMSAISPSSASMWSKYSFGKTQTSMSVNSFSSDYPRGDYQQSIGFANALSQAIIREEATGDYVDEPMRVGPLLEDESLELAGAPWGKEGTLKYKHHLKAVGKKAKDQNWVECFAVIEKGWMRLFQFNVSARSLRQKARNQKAGGVVGGGNWMENAQPLGQYLLRHTIASALPPPGYSKARPHVWALSLPTGAVHLFQAGTPEIVKEYVSSANYWSARLSKEPLVGGISNVEYGWSDMIINLSLVSESRASTTLPGPRPSFQTSIRSSFDQGPSKPRLPGDRVIISDWNPPAQSMMASQLLEVDQLRALSAYVKNVEEELRKHNELRPAMILAFTPRHTNCNKAMANWERKSSYLLHEIVKFRTYLECLQTAQREKERVYEERAEKERMKEKTEEEERVERGEEHEAAEKSHAVSSDEEDLEIGTLDLRGKKVEAG